MNELLMHYKSLPRLELQRQLRKLTGIEQLYLWEYIGLGWFLQEVRANMTWATHLGVKAGDVIGYRVTAGEVMGAALGDLMNVETQDPPYPDPFK
ncbi:MAG: hypothetical protein ACLP9L_27610 [Thermoguttaceae bacterium]